MMPDWMQQDLEDMGVLPARQVPALAMPQLIPLVNGEVSALVISDDGDDGGRSRKVQSLSPDVCEFNKWNMQYFSVLSRIERRDRRENF